jgi:NAD(P)-dependent dehydrogenase (short-subunit alcohol dehydrogenase family)
MLREGDTAVVTGASQGIGKASATALAGRGLRVLMVSRDPARAAAAVNEIRQASGHPDVESCLADLSSQASVRDLAGTLLERLDARAGRLAVLLHNAGVASPGRRTTADGLELQFAVNHLAPFLLTRLLWDRLVADAPARVITVSSRAHARGVLDFEDLQGERDYTGARAYDQSKLANVLFTYELARRLEGTGVTANCLHPGVVPTALNGYLGAGRSRSMATRLKGALRRTLAGRTGGGSRPQVSTAEEACRTSVHLATSPQVQSVTGGYFVDCRPAESSPVTHDAGLAGRLWAVSEQLTGLG